MKNFLVEAKKAFNKIMLAYKRNPNTRLILDVCTTTIVCMIIIFASYEGLTEGMKPPVGNPVVHAYLSSENEDIQLISFEDQDSITTNVTTITTLSETSTTTTVTSTTTMTEEVTTTTAEETTTTTLAEIPKTVVTTVSYIEEYLVEEEETFIPNTSGDQIFYYEDGVYGSCDKVSYADDKLRYHEALNYITEEERILICNLVGREYGAAWVPIEEKAKVVACVMNRVHAGSAAGYRDTVYGVLTQKGQFPGYLPNNTFTKRVIPSVVDAVDYYFMHQDSFGNIKSFTGDGKYNHFR